MKCTFYIDKVTKSDSPLICFRAWINHSRVVQWRKWVRQLGKSGAFRHLLAHIRGWLSNKYIIHSHYTFIRADISNLLRLCITYMHNDSLLILMGLKMAPDCRATHCMPLYQTQGNTARHWHDNTATPQCSKVRYQLHKNLHWFAMHQSQLGSRPQQTSYWFAVGKKNGYEQRVTEDLDGSSLWSQYVKWYKMLELPTFFLLLLIIVTCYLRW